MNEEGILTKAMIKLVASLLDRLIAFKNFLLETADGPVWEFILARLNDLSKKIPEPYVTQVREALDDILIDKDFESASKKAADLYQLLIKLPFKHVEETERQVFIQVFMAAAHLLAGQNTPMALAA